MNKKQALEILNEVINNYIDIFRSDKKEIKEIEKALKILKVLCKMYKRILFKVSNRLYLKLNKGCEQASAIGITACKHPKRLIGGLS